MHRGMLEPKGRGFVARAHLLQCYFGGMLLFHVSR